MNTPGFQIVNRTNYPLQVSLCQVGPLYYGIIKPGETFQRDTGAVWFTIKAAIFDGSNRISDWDCVWPVGALVGTVLIGLATGGLAAPGAVAMGATATATTSLAGTLVGAGMTASSALVVSGAVIGGLSSGAATSILKTIFTPENCTVSEAGCYAGPPWPFRTDVEPWYVVGGPQYRPRQGGMVELEGTPLRLTRTPPRPAAAPSMSRQQLEDEFGGCAEARKHGPCTDRDFTVSLYWRYLGHQPDANIDFHVGRVANRQVSRQQLETEFSGCAEARKHGPSTARDFTVSLYWRYLGHPPDAMLEHHAARIS